jgi:hypothetical protein
MNDPCIAKELVPPSKDLAEAVHADWDLDVAPTPPVLAKIVRRA